MAYRPMKGSLVLPLVVFGLLGTSCTSTGYLWQAAGGQCDISARARPIEDVVDDPSEPQQLRDWLDEVGAVKALAEENGLDPTPNYESYVSLDRPVAVYVVRASAPLSLEAKLWWFPIVGSVPYLGWFDKVDAIHFARELELEGWDVDLRGASAYSTLGYFEDPILSSMVDLDRSDGFVDLANTILHESVHATHYVDSQSVFNESLANFVGDELTELYLERRFGAASAELRGWRWAVEEGERRGQRLHQAYRDLEALYRSTASDEDKLRAKQTYLLALQLEIGFRRPITNATLLGYETYNAGTKQLAELYAACGHDWERFWRVARTVDEDNFVEEQQQNLEEVLAPARRACRE